MPSPFRRKRGDPQPTAKVAILLASNGGRFSKAAIERARELAAGEPIGVLVILRVYGSSYGLQHPGLFPTQKETQQQLEILRAAVEKLESWGGEVDGQLAATRKPGRVIANVAKTRQARIVVMDGPTTTGLRRFVEGDMTVSIRRRLRGQASMEVVSIFDQ
jgi:nucleotide-binding universal stress UspA family protein